MGEIRTILKDYSEYPLRLREIPSAPEQLYAIGKILPEEQCIAIVGTRICSPYGKQAALQIGRDLAKAGMTIVSGLAPGIDTWAHLAALEAGGRTIAVLGTGLDKESMYPKENIKLAKEIVAKGGLLLSEYPPGTKGTHFTFPQRNRLISGLSSGILVVEAKRKSGSLITAEFAKKQHRPLFAIPGPITSSTSQGTNYAIKYLGAVLTENANDILQTLGIRIKTDKEAIMGDSPEETAILETLLREALHIETIIIQTQLPTAKVAGILAILELQGKVRNLGNNTFTLIQ